MKAVDFILGFFGAVVAGLIPLYVFAYLIYVTLGLPMRRQERARLILELIETGLAHGHSLEETVVSVSRSRDRSVGVRFHLLAAYVESGWTAISALEKVAGLLPPPLIAMLKVGGEIGDPRR